MINDTPTYFVFCVITDHSLAQNDMVAHILSNFGYPHCLIDALFACKICPGMVIKLFTRSLRMTLRILTNILSELFVTWENFQFC